MGESLTKTSQVLKTYEVCHLIHANLRRHQLLGNFVRQFAYHRPDGFIGICRLEWNIKAHELLIALHQLEGFGAPAHFFGAAVCVCSCATTAVAVSCTGAGPQATNKTQIVTK